MFLAAETFSNLTFQIVFKTLQSYLTLDVVVEVDGNIHVPPSFQNFREEEMFVSVTVGVVSDDDPSLAGYELWSLPDI